MKKIEKLTIPEKFANSYYISNPVVFDRLVDLVSNNLHSYTAKLRSLENFDLLMWIQKSLPILSDKKYHLKTKIYWIFHDIHELQYCSREGCTNEVENVQNINDGYNKYHCSVKCAQQNQKMIEEKRERAQKRYGEGITCYQQTQEFKEKIIDTFNNFSKEKRESIDNRIRETWRSKSKDEIEDIVERRQQTSSKRYGTKVTSQSEQAKNRQAETNTLIYGAISPLASEEIRSSVDWNDVEEKRNQTKRKNNTFTTSKPEEQAYEMLCKKFGRENVERQYKTKEYPYFCDFFLKNLNLYIEFQDSWTHGNHPFDENSKEDVQRLHHLQKKMMQKKRTNLKSSNYYQNAIYVWTELDPRKRLQTQQNNLNFLEIWNLDELTGLLKSSDFSIIV